MKKDIEHMHNTIYINFKIHDTGILWGGLEESILKELQV